MKRRTLTVGFVLVAVSLAGLRTYPAYPPTAPQSTCTPRAARLSCTSFCLDNGGRAIFGTNFDNYIPEGLILVNKRGLIKTGWEPSTTGEYARWKARYGSVTFDLAGPQLVWAGMNEAGLVLSTMALHQTRTPRPDERPPLISPLWLQFILDTCATLEDVIATGSWVRIGDGGDHYLVCDREAECAVIEFIAGRMVVHQGPRMYVSALTNSLYSDLVRSWERDKPSGDSERRFARAADRVAGFEPGTSQDAVEYAFGTLAQVRSGGTWPTRWSIVFDAGNLQIFYRTDSNPAIRYVDLARLDFSCERPVQILDIDNGISGDVTGDFSDYTHQVGLAHTLSFVDRWEGVDLSPIEVDTLVRGLGGFRCASDKQADVLPVSGDPLLPPQVQWLLQTILSRLWPVWVALTVACLGFLAWDLSRGTSATGPVRLAWALAVLLFGPFGLLAYLLTYRWAHRESRQAPAAAP